jgi:hypothetical protein
MHPGSSRAGTGFGQTDVQQESVAAPGQDDAADAYQDPPGAAHQAMQQQPGSSSSSSRRTVEVVDDGDVGGTGRSKKRKGGAGRNPSGAQSASAAVEAGAPGGEGRRSVDVVDEADVGCTGKGKKKRGRGGGGAVAAGGAAQCKVPSSAGTPPSLVPSDDGGGDGGDGCDGDEGGGPRQRPMTSPDIHYPAADASAGGADECGMCAPPLCCYRKQVQSTCLQHQCTCAPVHLCTSHLCFCRLGACT